MQHAGFSSANGRTGDGLADLDSPSTRTRAFAAPEFAADPGPLAGIVQTVPRPVGLGFSTSGEIVGEAVHGCTIVGTASWFRSTEVCAATAEVEGRGHPFEADSTIAGHLLEQARTASLPTARPRPFPASSVKRTIRR